MLRRATPTAGVAIMAAVPVVGSRVGMTPVLDGLGLVRGKAAVHREALADGVPTISPEDSVRTPWIAITTTCSEPGSTT